MNADAPNANTVLARLDKEMRMKFEWKMMFAPVAVTQAKWPVLGPELTQPWKKNLRVAFGLEKYSSGAKLAYGRDTEFKLGEDPSKIPLPKTPETMKREVFRATEDSHMQTNVKARSAKRTPGPNASTSSRYGYMYDAADEVELGGVTIKTMD
ncbi:hypothetical protein GQ600_15634 [Phytophthora cactorum]|nr:hypothetical protein GQ600_15634 [Phytophthora cactorum]